MNLAIDIGNTRVKTYVFDQRILVEQHTFIGAPDVQWFNQLPQTANIDRCIIATVREIDQTIVEAIKAKTDVVFVTHSMPLPINILYQSPSTLGPDRICLACAAHSQFPAHHALVVSAGTCITYDLVDKEGNYLGGAISPGLSMRYQAMHHFTAKLPELPLSGKMVTLGTSTESSLRMGAETAAVFEVSGMISHFERAYPNLKVILTGGDAPFFEQHIENAIFAAPNFLAQGLNEILLWNNFTG